MFCFFALQGQVVTLEIAYEITVGYNCNLLRDIFTAVENESNVVLGCDAMKLVCDCSDLS